MPPPIPSTLIPHFSRPQFNSLTLITSVLDATANWILLRHIYAALFGVGKDEHDPHSPGFRSGTTQQETLVDRVVFVSFLRSFSMWSEIGKKVGLDFPALTSKKRVIYVNGLGGHAANNDIVSGGIIDLTSTDVRDVASTVRSTVGDRSTSMSGSKTTLIIDGIDFLIASQPSVTALGLSQLLLDLRNCVHHMVAVCSADTPLLHNPTASATPLEKEHLALLTIMAHQSNTVMQLRSLDTGAAKDVSGILRISQGGVYEDTEEEVEASGGEWLYQVKGDGSVRVWTRGE